MSNGVEVDPGAEILLLYSQNKNARLLAEGASEMYSSLLASKLSQNVAKCKELLQVFIQRLLPPMASALGCIEKDDCSLGNSVCKRRAS